MSRPRVFSGIQPTGVLTLGNYLGAIRQWVAMQATHECLYCVVDLHALTLAQNPETLRAAIRSTAAALIACGIDPTRVVLFAQSRVPAHAELAWLLMCTARMGWLGRMTQFKEKSGKDREGASVGLFTYPVLQAADVLVYRATHVPVGDDQRQHVELMRDIALKFNLECGREIFPLPEAIVPTGLARVMSLRDGTAKMSKSDPSDMSRINLTDDADLIADKIRRARTDAEPLPAEAAGLDGRPEARNLVAILAGLTDRSVDAVLAEHGGQGFGRFKPALADAVVATVAPIAARLREISVDPAMIDAVLADGARRARALAAPTLADAQAALGLR